MADTPNQEGFKFTWDWLDPLGEGFLWSVLTVALAIFVTFFIDFFVIELTSLVRFYMPKFSFMLNLIKARFRMV